MPTPIYRRAHCEHFCSPKLRVKMNVQLMHRAWSLGCTFWLVNKYKYKAIKATIWSSSLIDSTHLWHFLGVSLHYSWTYSNHLVSSIGSIQSDMTADINSVPYWQLVCTSCWDFSLSGIFLVLISWGMSLVVSNTPNSCFNIWLWWSQTTHSCATTCMVFSC